MCNAGRAGLEALASAALPALDALVLCGNQAIGDGGLQAIAGTPWATRLRTLRMEWCGISGAALFDALPSFPRLDVLIIESYVINLNSSDDDSSDNSGGCIARSLPGLVFAPKFELVMGGSAPDAVDDEPHVVVSPDAFCLLAAVPRPTVDTPTPRPFSLR